MMNEHSVRSYLHERLRTISMLKGLRTIEDFGTYNQNFGVDFEKSMIWLAM